MKNIIILLICCSLYCLLPSCEEMMGDYLDKAPGVDVTEDTIFSSKVQVETFVASTYRHGIHIILGTRGGDYTGNSYNLTASSTDEAEEQASYTESQRYNAGNLTTDALQDPRITPRWKAIRMANILLQRIDEAPELEPSYVSQVKGEARFIRALNYFEMFKRYGGMPIVDKKFELTDEFKVPRNTVKEMVDFIVADCDAAVPLLPDVYTSDMRGRATKGAALLLKAKTLLYAASPLFNTATPYLDMTDPVNNPMICYGNYDVSRWQLAADAAKAVLDWAPSGGVALVTDKGTDKNYKYMAETCDNPEIILANKLQGKVTTGAFPWTHILPHNMYQSWNMGISMTFNFVKKYEKQDGTPQTWDPAGGADLTQKYNELDRRFKQTVTVTGDYWNVDYPVMNSHQGGLQAVGCSGGQWFTKFIPPTMRKSPSVPAMANEIIFRLGEAYLDYAEALNEAQGPVAGAYAAVNTIRTRSGQPDLPAGLSQAQFRERVRNERAIELVFEDHRLWDINRWLIAEEDGIMKGNMYGIKTYLNPAAPNFRYEVYVFEVRTFLRRMYLQPHYRSEVQKGYLVQNPGY